MNEALNLSPSVEGSVGTDPCPCGTAGTKIPEGYRHNVPQAPLSVVDPAAEEDDPDRTRELPRFRWVDHLMRGDQVIGYVENSGSGDYTVGVAPSV